MGTSAARGRVAALLAATLATIGALASACGGADGARPGDASVQDTSLDQASPPEGNQGDEDAPSANDDGGADAAAPGDATLADAKDSGAMRDAGERDSMTGEAAADASVDSSRDAGRHRDASPEAACSADGSGPLFGSTVVYPAERSAFSTATADFNRDGKLDAVVTDLAVSGHVAVYLGNGDGTLQKPIRSMTISGPNGLAPADFDRDGHLDVATAAYSEDLLYVLFGKGDGSFGRVASYPVADGPVAVEAVDVNLDGVLDLVTASLYAESLEIFLGNADGSFQAPLGIAIAGSPASLAWGDFDRDGKPDLAAAAAANTGVPGGVFVLLGHGDGSFAAPVRYPEAASQIAFLTAADFDEDGLLDLVFTNGAVQIMFGKGDGTFGAPVVVWPGLEPFDVTDVNGDGHLDIAVGSYSVHILLGAGDGTFADDGKYGRQMAGTSGDLNGDGFVDLIGPARPEMNLGVLLGTGCKP